MIGATLFTATPGLGQPPTPPALKQLRQDAGGEVEITWNPLTGTPSFIRGRIPLSALGMDSGAKPSAAAIAFADRYARVLGIKQASSELKVMQDETDVLGMRHVTLQQVYQGVDVYGGSVKVHLSADGQEVVAVSSSFVPDIQVPDVQPRITADQALAAARKALPNGILLSGPELVIYPGQGERPGASAKLAWLVELRDDTLPARNVYIVDAIEGIILDVLDRLYREIVGIGPAALQRAMWQQQPVYNTAFLTDAQLEDYTSMASEEIRLFLESHNSYFSRPITDVDGVVFDPPQVIAQAAIQYRINPKVLLATLEKESNGVTRSTRPSDTTMRFLMGCVSPSTAREQLTCAAERFRAYHDQLTNTGSTISGWRVGVPKLTEDGVLVTPATKAVAGQFTYTPYAGVQWGGNQPSVGGVYLFYYAWNEFGFNKQPNRKTYDANHGYTLPGTLARSEGQGPTGDRDIDNAHDFAGATYNYYWIIHGRDSYDNHGATLTSTANYGRSYMNAYWNGEQTVYGDYFPVKDVVAHEWTHAVTEHSANLEYRWQSGALNESFSDIFGAMVDRDDWLIGEDLPPHILGGREAIRDLSNPRRFGQPDHTRDWVETCSDNEGVHTNSGITNKAYYNIATAIGKDKAERIFYRALTVYLHSNSSLEDARAAALQSAQDLYGANSAEYNAVRDGFNAVGLDGQWNPPPNDCTCAATLALSDESVYPDRVSALDVAATLYRVRDELLTGTRAGEHYRALYEEHTGRIAWLLLLNPDLRAKGGQILKAVTPGLSHLMDGQGAQDLITQELVNDVLSFLQRLAEEDRAKGGGELADTIEREKARIEWNRLAGMTFEEAWQYIQSRVTAHPFVIYLPVVLK
jgi:Zn-dependent metalloprotease